MGPGARRRSLLGHAAPPLGPALRRGAVAKHAPSVRRACQRRGIDPAPSPAHHNKYARGHGPGRWRRRRPSAAPDEAPSRTRSARGPARSPCARRGGRASDLRFEAILSAVAAHKAAVRVTPPTSSRPRPTRFRAAPAMNGRWEATVCAISPTIGPHRRRHGAQEKGLVVPVVKERLGSLEQIGARLDDTRRARDGQLAPPTSRLHHLQPRRSRLAACRADHPPPARPRSSASSRSRGARGGEEHHVRWPMSR